MEVDFVLDRGVDLPLEPGKCGPISLTAREWKEFDLQKHVEEIISSKLDLDEPEDGLGP